MSRKNETNEPTFSPDVWERLLALAEDLSTAARFLDVSSTIGDFCQKLEENLPNAIKSHAPREVMQEGVRYLVFVIPSPMVLVRAVDTLCIIYRPDDKRFHVHSYANCSSMKQYEETRSAMRSDVAGNPNIADLLK